MNKSDILTLYDHNYWANARVLDAMAKVTPEQFVAPARLSHGSLRGALVHTLGAEVVWRLRYQGSIAPPTMPSETEFPTGGTARALARRMASDAGVPRFSRRQQIAAIHQVQDDSRRSVR